MGKIIIIFMLMASVAYAELSPITIEESKDHKTLSDKINQLVREINYNKKLSDRTDAQLQDANVVTQKAINDNKKSIGLVRSHYEVTSASLTALFSNLTSIREKVGDPTGTIADVRTKFITLMDTIDASPQHIKVKP